MKKSVITVALFAVLGTLAVSCQKETLVDPSGVEARVENVYKVSYSVDGVTLHATLHGQGEWNAFLGRLVALAKEGHRVSFRAENAPESVVSSKETVTYITKSEEDAINWANKMYGDGYEVTIIFDEETGEFTCIAIK